MRQPIRTHLDDPSFRMQPIRLSDSAMEEFTRSRPVTCVDVVIFDGTRKTLFLAKRRIHSAKGWWEMGGGVLAGEDFVVAAQRKMQLETGLIIPLERFIYLLPSRIISSKRNAEPQELGQDSVVYHYAVELSEDERNIVAGHLDPDEYEHTAGLREFTRADLEETASPSALRDVYDTLFPE